MIATGKHLELEQRRLELQAALDGVKSHAERNRLGQFATPTALATDILELAQTLIPRAHPVRFLDPAIGTGSFYSALLRRLPGGGIDWARGFEIDPHYGLPAQELWKDTPLVLSLEDFTRAKPPRTDDDKATLIVCNPPYVRHHHLNVPTKQHLRAASISAAGVEFSGLAGLYCHFMAVSHSWMAKNAIAIWLIPSEFMDVNYGRSLKQYLLNRVTLMRIHRFDPQTVQFDDALVSSAVVVIRNCEPTGDHQVEFTYGGQLAHPAKSKHLSARSLAHQTKWTKLSGPGNCGPARGQGPKLSDLFTIKRGIATGANSFFVLDEPKAKSLGLPSQFLRPILPSPRFLPDNEIEADKEGRPVINPRQVLVDCRLGEEQVRREFPELWAYFESGKAAGIHKRYLSMHRDPWYSQEDRQPAPILCTYMGRASNGKSAFRFLLNHSNAIVANVYLMLYPKPALKRALDNPDVLRAVWTALNAMPWDDLLGVGRVYGGGLHKMEPKELAEAPADSIGAALPLAVASPSRQLALDL